VGAYRLSRKKHHVVVVVVVVAVVVVVVEVMVVVVVVFGGGRGRGGNIYASSLASLHGLFLGYRWEMGLRCGPSGVISRGATETFGVKCEADINVWVRKGRNVTFKTGCIVMLFVS